MLVSELTFGCSYPCFLIVTTYSALFEAIDAVFLIALPCGEVTLIGWCLLK